MKKKNNENVEQDNKLIEALAATKEANKVYKRKIFTKGITTVLLTVTLFLLAALGSLYLISENGIFTIGIIDPEDNAVSLSLFSSKDLTNPTTHLSYDSHGPLDNIAGEDIPNNLDLLDGDHCGENYLCYTFYLQNVGENNADVTAQLLVSQVVLGADEAIRIKLYSDGVPDVYAKKAKDGNPEPETTPFLSDSLAYESTFSLVPQEVKKYTIVVWLDGDDPECINDICGGFVRLDMKFNGKAETEN